MAGLADQPGEASIETTLAASGEATLKLGGEVDSGNVAELADAIAGLAGQSVHAIVFDIASLSFIDSAGLAALVRAAADFESIRVRNASPVVRRTIETTGLGEALGLDP